MLNCGNDFKGKGLLRRCRCVNKSKIVKVTICVALLHIFIKGSIGAVDACKTRKFRMEY